MADNLSPFDAAAYEDGIRKTMPFYETFFTETVGLIKSLDIEPRVWLDTGCGTGALVARAHAAFPDTTFLLADPSREMLGRAEAGLGYLPKERWKVVGAVGTESVPDLTPDSPQVITAFLAHHYFPEEERRAATERCHALLDDGGVYVTFENIRPTTEAGKNIALARWKAFQMSQGKTENEADGHASRYGTAYFPITVDAHLAVLRGAGFTVAELFWFSHMQAGFYAIK